MNKSETQLRTNPRIVPQDLLLKFGYSPDNGIKFDSAAQTLSFYQGGIQRIDIRSFGLAVRNGEGLVVGHTAQIVDFGGLGALELQVLGTAAIDSSMAVARWSASAGGPAYVFGKSRNATIGSFTVVQPDDVLGSLTFTGDDGTSLDSIAAQIRVQVDGTPGANDMPGRIILSTTANGANNPIEALRIDSSQNVQMRNESYLWIGPDSAATGFVHGNLAVGLVINQEANDDLAIVLKSSDVVTGLTTAPTGPDVEGDDYFVISKNSGAAGGAHIQVIGDNVAMTSALIVSTIGGQASTTKTTAGQSLVQFEVYQHDGVNGLADVAANGNIFGIRARVGGTRLTRWMLDEDGDVFVVTTVDVTGTGNAVAATAFDYEEDAHALRAYTHLTADPSTVIRNEYDDLIKYNESSLLRMGILGAPIADGGMTNQSQLIRLLTSNSWQQYSAHMSLVERVDELEGQLAIANTALAALTA